MRDYYFLSYFIDENFMLLLNLWDDRLNDDVVLMIAYLIGELKIFILGDFIDEKNSIVITFHSNNIVESISVLKNGIKHTYILASKICSLSILNEMKRIE